MKFSEQKSFSLGTLLFFKNNKMKQREFKKGDKNAEINNVRKKGQKIQKGICILNAFFIRSKVEWPSFINALQSYCTVFLGGIDAHHEPSEMKKVDNHSFTMQCARNTKSNIDALKRISVAF
jgi:hypothetical protein